MTSQALYRKWRSQTFDEIIGQHHVTDTLMNALKLDRVTHAYLFAGPRGTGKTSTARLLAKAVNCRAENVADRPCNQCTICTAINEGRLLDLIEIDAASNTGVDDIRDLRDKVNFRPSEARIKFYIIDEVHMLSNSAFNALLKTLEEPPGHVIFVLATTEPEKIPATITSRCQRFDFKRIRLEEIVQRLAHIASQEGFSVEQEALEYIARQGSGSMRDAISLLDQLTAYGADIITLELVRTVLGVVASHSVAELIDALVDRDVAAGLDIINRVISDGADPRQFGREVVEYLRAVMLTKLGNGAGLLNLPEETLNGIKKQAGRVDGPAIVRATDLFNAALVDIKSGLLAIPHLPLELAFVEAVSPTRVQQVEVEEAPPVVKSQPAQAQVNVKIREGHEARPRQRPAVAAPEADSGSKRPEPAEPVAPEVTAADGGELTIEVVSSCLELVIREIEPRNKTMAETLRSDVRLYRVSGREIFFVTSDFNKGRFEKPQPKSAIDAAFSHALGQPVVVRFISDKTLPASASQTSQGARPGSHQPGEDDLETLLKTAQELGGEIGE